MGAGYSIVNGNIAMDENRMQKIYAAYCNPSSYDIWKMQLENSVKSEKKINNLQPPSPVK
jgi:hypothetical protein